MPRAVFEATIPVTKRPRPTLTLWGPLSLLSNGYRGTFPGGKAQLGRDTYHSPPSGAEIMNEQELYILAPLPSKFVLWDCFNFFIHMTYLYNCRRRENLKFHTVVENLAG